MKARFWANGVGIISDFKYFKEFNLFIEFTFASKLP